MSGGWDDLRVWDAKCGRVQLVLKSRGHVAVAAAFSPDGRRMVTVGVQKAARIWDTTTGELVRVLRGHTRALLTVAWSRNGQRIATGGLDGIVNLWDPETGQVVHALGGHRDQVWSADFDPTGRRLVTSDLGGPPRVWDVESGMLLFSLVGGPPGSWPARFSLDGRQIATAGLDRKIRLWDASSGQLVRSLETRSTEIYGLSYCPPDSRRLAVLAMDNGGVIGFDPGAIEIWDPQQGRKLLDLKNHTDCINTIRFSPNGRSLLTTACDCTARQEESFPWRESDYAGLPGANLEKRVEAYAKAYRRERLATESAAPTPVEPRSQDTLDRTVFPQRAPEAGPNLINLDRCYTGLLDATFYPIGDPREWDDDLEGLLTPKGLITMAGLPFDVRGVVVLRPFDPARWWDRYPERVNGLAVGRRVQRLQTLHGIFCESAPNDGTAVGSFVWHYADGTERETEIVYGRDVREWRQGGKSPDPKRECERGHVAWDGTNPVAGAQGTTRRLYVAAYENPQPEVEVATLDFVSKMTIAAPFVVALTLEP